MQAKKLTLVDFSSRLQELAKNKKIAQKELAELCGVSPAAVSKWFSGGKIKSDHAVKLSEFFGVSVDYMLGLDSETRIANAAEYAKQHGGTAAVMDEALVKYQAQNYQELYFVEKAARERLEKRLERVHKGLIKMVEQLGGAE
jgi:transcriptional regulator with XRE-family HTH domain